MQTLLVFLFIVLSSSGFGQNHPTVYFETEAGPFVFELFADETPGTVAHFLKLVEGTHYRDPKSGKAVVGKYYEHSFIFQKTQKAVLLGCEIGNGKSDVGIFVDHEINLACSGLSDKYADSVGLLDWYFQQKLLPLWWKKRKDLDPSSEFFVVLKDYSAHYDCRRWVGRPWAFFYRLEGFEYQEQPTSPLQPGSLFMLSEQPNRNSCVFGICLSEPEEIFIGRVTVFGKIIFGYDTIGLINQSDTDKKGYLVDPIPITQTGRF